MMDLITRAVGRYVQAGAGLVSVAGVATTAVSATQPGDHLTTLVGAVATFFAFLVHRNLAMKDVRRVVREEVRCEVGTALKTHEDHCRWIIRPSPSAPPRAPARVEDDDA